MAVATKGRSISWSQVAAFRLLRHHLLKNATSDPVTICGDVCGVQAQLMSAAHLALWARAPQLSRQEIEFALWKRRILVKTSVMRQTLHLLPAADYSLYISALKASRLAALLRIMARIGVGEKEVNHINSVLMDVIGEEPVPQRELVEKIKPRISRKICAQMKLFWNAWPLVRPAIIAGLICYGPDSKREVTFVRVDRWLKRSDQIEESEAKEILLRRYMRAYAPATLQDFSRWSGISMKEAKPVWNAVQEDMVEVSIEGAKAWVLRDDLSALQSSKLPREVVHLLPSFDSYLLAHVNKNHLVHPQHYKRVYRNQGWLSPVILLNGRVVGIWARKTAGAKSSVQTELFEKVPRSVLSGIERLSQQVLGFIPRAAARASGAFL